MSTLTNSTESNLFPWWVGLVQGIFILIVGLLLLTNPLATTLVIVQFLGIYWLVSGVFALVGLFINRERWVLKLIAGIFGILAGLGIMQHPLWSTFLVPSVLVIFIGVDGLIIGITSLIEAFQGGGWGPAILGILSTLFGLFLLGSPMLSALALPWVYGIMGVVGGILLIIVAFQLRKVESAM